MKKPLIRFGFILLLFIGLFIYGKSISNKNYNYLNEINLKLSGRVTELTKLKQGHDYGIITVDIKNSSLDYYDERRHKKVYFGVIKNSKAEIIVTNISLFQERDSIHIDGTNYRITRNNDIIKEGIWDLPFDIVNNPYLEISRKIKL